jgi:hypothetical protein
VRGSFLVARGSTNKELVEYESRVCSTRTAVVK